MRFLLGVLVGFSITVSMGCAANVVYVPDGSAVRLRETIRNAPIWIVNEYGEPEAGEMDIPAGWYALPLREE